MTILVFSILGCVGVAVVGYAALIAWHRLRYGTVHHIAGANDWALLDCFIPNPEVLEHHHIAIDAPAAVVLAAAKRMRLLDSPLVRTTIKVRELALGGDPDRRMHPGPLVEQMQSIGWVVLAEWPDREIVLGAATVPWCAQPVFRSIEPAQFEVFRKPGFVKIAWSLRVEPIDERRCVFHTETRVTTTDRRARARFKRYWSFVAPGVELIRLAMLRPLKHECERRYTATAA